MSKPLEEYGLIGDGESAALLGRDGSLDWLCWPRFDSDACFAALLGKPDHGRWLIGLAETAGTTREWRYVPDTLILETTLRSPGGTVRVIDFMPMREDDPAVIRLVVGVEGSCRLQMDLKLRFDYGTMLPWMEAIEGGVIAKAGPHQVILQAPVPVQLSGPTAAADFVVTSGQRLAFVLRHGAAGKPPPAPLDAEALLTRTQAFWHGWIGRFDSRKTRWPDAVRRSLLTLKAMIYRPTGGLVAAPTTSLPEAAGGQLNWDYRYCWLRDSTFTLGALINAGYHQEAQAWRDWLLRAIGGSPDDMRIMYRLDGDRHLDEWAVAALPGYRYARPVRIGNAAAKQTQVDVWGEVLDTLHLADLAGLPRTSQVDHLRKGLVEHLETIWDQSGSGVWESRQEPRHYTYSRVMAWVGVDRVLRGHGSLDDNLARRLSALRDDIHREICQDGWNDGLGSFTQYYGGQSLDASLLLMPLVGFLPATDPRIASTMAAVSRTLTEDGLIRRTIAGSEGMAEGAFLACSCWMADCLNMQGKTREAGAQFERVLAVRNELGLLSEEYDVPARHLSGNFPQALTHLAVVNTALELSGAVLHRGGG